MTKDFDLWNDKKKQIDTSGAVPMFKEREIWWCSLGINVGHEEDGKGKLFRRPVLVIKKFNQRLFWGIPLTTQIKNTPHYHVFTFLDKKQCAMLTHLRLLDATRITHRMGRLADKEIKSIYKKIIGYCK